MSKNHKEKQINDMDKYIQKDNKTIKKIKYVLLAIMPTFIPLMLQTLCAYGVLIILKLFGFNLETCINNGSAIIFVNITVIALTIFCLYKVMQGYFIKYKSACAFKMRSITNKKKFLISIAFNALFVVGLSIISQILTNYISKFTGIEINASLEYAITAQKVLLIISTFAVPIMEEFIRWVTINALMTLKCNRKMTNIIQACLFGMSHLNPVKLVYTIPLGLFLGRSMYEYNNIWLNSIFHIIFNLIAVIPLYVKIQQNIIFLPVFSGLSIMFMLLSFMFQYKNNEN